MQTAQTTENGTGARKPMNPAVYAVEPIPGAFGRFKVYNATNDRYIVDAREMNCTCPSFEFNQNRGGLPCKHLTHLRDIIAAQIASYYADQKAVVLWEAKGQISREECREMGEAIDREIFALQSIADNLWGSGDMYVPQEFTDAPHRQAA